MKILFIGNLIPEKYSVTFENNSLAGNKFQTKFVNYLRKSEECDVLSYIAVPLTDDNKKSIANCNDEHNTYYYKEKNIIGSICKYRKQIVKIKENYDLVIAYNVAYPWLFLPRMVNKKNTTLILADFSDVDSFKNICLKLYAWICKRDIQKYKYVIGLSEKTKNLLNSKQKFICMPGGIDMKDYQNVSATAIKDKIKIMYSGNLSNVTGVDMLVEAFKNIKNDNIELIITGRGELNDYVKESQNDPRIKYYGSLEYEKYLELLNSANILINPRNMNLPENKNNFPSKVLDYLAVGKVVISTKFIGYEKFIDNFIFCDSNIDALKNAIEKTIDDYDGIFNDYFIRNVRYSREYDWEKQIEKIIGYIDSEGDKYENIL